MAATTGPTASGRLIELGSRETFAAESFGVIRPSQLTAAERLVRIDRIGDQFLLTPRQTRSGTALLGRVTIRVSPPMPARTFLGLLCVVERIDIGQHLVIPLKEDRSAPIFQSVLSGALVVAAEQTARQHIKQSYVTKRERLEVLRGRPVWEDEIGRPGRRKSMMCEYFAKTADILPNALIAAALERCGPHLPRGEQRRRAERQAFSWLGLAQPPVLVTRELFDKARRQLDRQSRHYRPALALAEAVLLGSRTVGDGPGNEVGFPIFDVATLFESFCERVVKAIAGTRAVTIAVQTSDRRALMDGNGGRYRSIRPDIVVYRGELPLGVFDAKFKPDYAATKKASTADIFQLFFYAERLRRRSRTHEPVASFLIAPRIAGTGTEMRSVAERTIVFSEDMDTAKIRILPLSLVGMVDDLFGGSSLANAARTHAPELVDAVEQLIA